MDPNKQDIRSHYSSASVSTVEYCIQCRAWLVGGETERGFLSWETGEDSTKRMKDGDRKVGNVKMCFVPKTSRDHNSVMVGDLSICFQRVSVAVLWVP